MKRFTLVELLVVVAIIGILVSLLLPSLEKARYVTKTSVCGSNQSQLYKGIMTIVDGSDDKIPTDNSQMNRNPWDCMVMDDLVDSGYSTKGLTCSFGNPPTSIQSKTYTSLATWFKEGNSGEINNWSYVTPGTLSELTSEHLFISDIVNTNNGQYTKKNLTGIDITNVHTFRGRVVDIVSTFADGHISIKKNSLSNPFLSNAWGEHWRTQKQPEEP